MKIAMGSDHGGIHLKNHLKDYLELKGYEVIDKGTYTEESCDYPDYAAKVGHAVTGGEADLGILVCGTGLGISIAANKIKGVRAAVCGDVYSAVFNPSPRRMAAEKRVVEVLPLVPAT